MTWAQVVLLFVMALFVYATDRALTQLSAGRVHEPVRFVGHVMLRVYAIGLAAMAFVAAYYAWTGTPV